ncbi:MAG: alpha/beta hydrolase, partial [Bacteroidetes bacterium]|nr:alpha/beta hydrolase [Bacteroidota bacterium]
MKKIVATLILTILSFSLYPQSNKITGSWQGTLSVSGTELRLVFHINENDEGALEGTMDSPDQGAYGIALGDIYVNGDSVIILIPNIFGSYKGKFTNSENIKDTWNQGVASFPLDIAFTEHTDVLLRPQEPQPPYLYEVREVEIFNKAEDITLSGTLTLPEGKGPFPAVILVSGSGPQNRNEEIFGHKPFHVLADYLTRNGIAVLRYDDRGIGKSGGSFGTATTENFATDARAALLHLESYPEISPGLTGIIGHSEGGLIAPMVAAETDEVDFIVMLAGPGLKGEEILILQTRLIAKANGADNGEIKKSLDFNKKAYAIVIHEPDPQKAGKQLEKLVDDYLKGLNDNEKNDPQNDR